MHALKTRILRFCFAAASAGIMLLLSPSPSFAQTPSFSTHSFTSAVGNSVVLHGDLNNDGYEDLITSPDPHTFRVYLSKGDGNYRAPVTYTIPGIAFANPAALADFNNDGKLDLIVQAAYNFFVYLGNGDGMFRSPVSVAISPLIWAMAAADVNHDGNPDILLSTDEGLQVMFGKGDGSFYAGPTTSGILISGGLLTGDFDGDGNIDVAVSTFSPDLGTQLQIWHGDGAGHFTITYSDNPASYQLFLIAADVNGDGRSDLIGTSLFWQAGRYYYPVNDLTVYYGRSDGSMAPAQIPLTQYGVGQVAVADFNGDGIPDIAVFETACDGGLDCTRTTAATMNVISGAGNDEFAPDTPVSSLESNPGPLFAIRGNRDTKADLVFTNPTTSNTPILTLLNTTTGNFPTCPAPNAAVGIAQCSPTAGGTDSSPVNFSIGVAAAEPLRKIELWIDGKKQFEQFAGAFSNYGFLDDSVPLAAGSHRVVVIASGWDNSQKRKVSSITVTASSSCSAPSSAGVHICSPAGGSTVASPVNVQASAKVTGTIAHTELWVDEAKKYTSANTALNTAISLAAGTHRFAVVAVNTAGQKWESTVNATVTASPSCSAPSSAGVHICSPASGSTVNSPVKVQAAAKVTGTIAHTELWVDQVKKYSSASSTLNTSISLAAGTHRFAVVAVNTAGQKWESAINATVR